MLNAKDGVASARFDSSKENLAAWRNQDFDRMMTVIGSRFGDARIEFFQNEASTDDRYTKE